MKHRHLHEVAKFCAGLVGADVLFLWWAWAEDLFPVNFVGISVTSDMLVPALVFDVALFFVLVHYGWNIGKMPGVRERVYLLIAGIVFGAVAVLHLTRVLFNADVNLAGWDLPIWLSWVGIAITAYLSYMSFRLASRMR